jgi:hypothetical protein
MCINSILFKMDNIKKQLTNAWINLLVILLIAEYCRVDCHRLRVRELNNNKDLGEYVNDNECFYVNKKNIYTFNVFTSLSFDYPIYHVCMPETKNVLELQWKKHIFYCFRFFLVKTG